MRRQIRETLTRVKYRIQGRQFVHFLHIGKTGGTAFKHALRRNPADDHYAIFLHPHRVHLNDIPKGDWVIFTVRSPISRFVSGFYNRLLQGQPKRFAPWTEEEKRAFEYFSTANQLATAISSPSAEEKARAQEAMASIDHIKSSYWDWFRDEEYFRSRSTDIFFIGFQEHLTEDFAILKSKLGMPDDAQLPADKALAHRTPDHVDRTLTEEAVANLRRWYEDDFRFIALCQEVIRQRPDVSSPIFQATK